MRAPAHPSRHRTFFVPISAIDQDARAANRQAGASFPAREDTMNAVRAITLLVLAAALQGAAAQAADPATDLGWQLHASGQHAAALTRFRQAAARGDPLAQFNLAVMLLAGEGGPAGPSEGLIWLRRAAERGLPRAQHAMAALHERGEHVPRSQEAATGWYRKAAEQGWRDSQVELATQHFLGRGAVRDEREAAHWYEQAAAQGHPGACYLIASFYEHGRGVPRDLARAARWYARAAALGERGADLKARETRQLLLALDG